MHSYGDHNWLTQTSIQDVSADTILDDYEYNGRGQRVRKTSSNSAVLDFTGGMLIEVSYISAPPISEVKANLGDAVIQTFGTAMDIVVRIPNRRHWFPGTDLFEFEKIAGQSALIMATAGQSSASHFLRIWQQYS